MNTDVVAEELSPDWVYIHPVLSEFRKEVELERLPNLIDQTLVVWLHMHPELKVRASLPIVEGGSMVACHVWLD